MPDITHLLIALVAIGVTIFALRAMRGGKTDYRAEIEGLVSSALLSKQQGHIADAQANLERAIKLLQYPDNRDDAKLASCYIHLAEIYDRADNFSGAAATRESLINLWSKQLKSGNQEALLDIDFALTHNSFGPGTAQVLEFYEKVIEAKERIFGERSQQVADSLLIAAKLLKVLGDKEGAELAQQKAIELRPKS